MKIKALTQTRALMKIYSSIEDFKRVKLDFQEKDIYGKNHKLTQEDNSHEEQ